MSDFNLVIEPKKPYVFEGEEFKKIDVGGLEDLRGSDLTKARRTYKQTGGTEIMAQIDPHYSAILAATVLSKPVEFINDMPAQLYTQVTTTVMGFLNEGSDKQTSEE